MNVTKFLLVFGVCLLSYSIGMAAPHGGCWSTDAGDFAAGTWQEVFYGGGEGQVGNVISASNAEWSLTGATLYSHEWLKQDPNEHIHKTIYVDGVLSLDIGGPWETMGDPMPYIASLGDLVVITTKTFIGGQIASLSWEISATGTFDDYDYRTVEVRASYSGIPTPMEEEGVPGMTDVIDSANIDVILTAGIRITPRTLNLKSRGRWISCKVWLPEDVQAADIDVDSILLEDTVGPAWAKLIEDDQILLSKFLRAEVQEILEPGMVELILTGELVDGTKFVGSDTIKVIKRGFRRFKPVVIKKDKPKKHKHKKK